MNTWYIIHRFQIPKQRIKSRNGFIKGTIWLNITLSESRLKKWEKLKPITITNGCRLQSSETLPPGHKNKWMIWKSLNRSRTGIGRREVSINNGWRLLADENAFGSCGLFVCAEYTNTCSKKDLIQANQKEIDLAE